MAPVAATAAARAADRRRREQREATPAATVTPATTARATTTSRRAATARATAERDRAGSGRDRGRAGREPRRVQRPIGSLRRRVSGPVDVPVGPPPLRDSGAVGTSASPQRAVTEPVRQQRAVTEPVRRERAVTEPVRRERAVTERIAPRRPLRERRVRQRQSPERPAGSRLRQGRAVGTAGSRRRLRLRIDPRWLDRIVRGRLWIPLLAMLLIGVVATRVEVLKLNSRAGSATQLASQLQSTNQLLRDRVSRLSSPQRIESLAAKYGMVQSGPMDPHFVQAGQRGTLTRAINSITAPAPATFLAGLQAEQVAKGDTVNANVTLASGGATSSTTTGAGSGAPAGG